MFGKVRVQIVQTSKYEKDKSSKKVQVWIVRKSSSYIIKSFFKKIYKKLTKIANVIVSTHHIIIIVLSLKYI